MRMFWETKTRGKISNENEIQSEKVAKEREQMLMNIENDRKKAKTVNKKKKLQEDCFKMMTRLVEDWERKKHQEEEEVFKKLKETEKKICAAVVMEMTPADDSQVR